jgi:hypothetical protein
MTLEMTRLEPIRIARFAMHPLRQPMVELGTVPALWQLAALANRRAPRLSRSMGRRRAAVMERLSQQQRARRILAMHPLPPPMVEKGIVPAAWQLETVANQNAIRGIGSVVQRLAAPMGKHFLRQRVRRILAMRPLPRPMVELVIVPIPWQLEPPVSRHAPRPLRSVVQRHAAPMD